MKKIVLLALISCSLIFLNSATGEIKQGDRLNVAKFSKDGSLVRPRNIDMWVFLGASVGHGYPAEGGGSQFSMNNPGQIQVIQMEPVAYEYFKKWGHYADGTMLSLSFYNTQEAPQPAVDGVVQGSLNTFEIHLLDKQNLKDKRAFYLYAAGEEIAPMIPEGNDCVDCHNTEAHYDGTFSNFYPIVRDEILGGLK